MSGKIRSGSLVDTLRETSSDNEEFLLAESGCLNANGLDLNTALRVGEDERVMFVDRAGVLAGDTYKTME